MDDYYSSYLQTYPRILEEHTDSSDFEDNTHDLINVAKLKKNQRLPNKGLLRKVKQQPTVRSSSHENLYVNGRSEKKHLAKKVQVPDKRHRINNIESDSAERLRKYQNDYRDDSCQVYSVTCRNPVRVKKKKRVVSFSQPAYEVTCHRDVHFNSTKIVNYTWPHHTLQAIKESETTTNDSVPMYSSISSEIDNVTLEDKSDSRNYSQCNNNSSKYSNEKNPKKMSDLNYKKKQNFHVFSAPQNATIGVCTSFNNENPKSDVSQARSDVFWDYVANKIQLKSRYEIDTCSKPCHCAKDLNEKEIIETPSGKPDPYSTNAVVYNGNEESQKSKTNKKTSCHCPKKRNNHRNIQNQDEHEIPKYLEESLDPNYYDDIRKSFNEETLESEITPETKPCQHDHDLVTKALCQKYNGEILCIHNPPCILVNGCLNIPSKKEEMCPTWYLTEDTKPSYYQNCNNNQNHHLKNHQQQSKYIKIMQYYNEEDRIEKEMQSTCQHQPPCKFVRQCCKLKHSPKFDHCCVHIPMCRKIPQCILESNDYHGSCKHKPKCLELPICVRDFVAHEVSNVDSEVKKPADKVCYHRPQCIKIPRCLGRMMCEGQMPYSAIPDCPHDPPCERIPACFRRSPKMVSRYSQYPTPCRIV